MKLTKQEAIKLHRKMWKIISEMSDEELKEFEDPIIYPLCNILDIEQKTISKMGYDDIAGNSFCCEYAAKQNTLPCKGKCPIKWCDEDEFDSICCVTHDSSLYAKILCTKDFDTFRALAKEISELPERGN